MREHGTKACYVFGPDGGGDRSRGCRCGACSRANREAENERNRQIAYGRWQPFVDAGPARGHLKTLMGSGIGWKRAAELAGVSGGTVTHLLYGGPGGRPPSRRIRPETEAAILAVRPSLDVMADMAWTDATGTRRRVQALAARGWSQGRVAARLGVSRKNFNAMMRRGRVSAATARAVAALYAELWDAPPPEETPRQRDAANRARRHAAEQGWPPPMAWGEDIGDPAAEPAAGWQRDPERKCRSGALTAAEARELLGFGLSRADAAKRLGVTVAAMEKAMERYPETEAEAAA